MKKIIQGIVFSAFLCSITLINNSLYAQSPSEMCVQVSAKYLTSPNRVVLKWAKKTNVNGFKIYRKALKVKSWGTPIATLPTTALGYTDTASTMLKDGIAVEYRVESDQKIGTANYPVYGYIIVGKDIPAVSDKGAILLLVEDTCTLKLEPEVKRLINDLIGDGWSVIRRNVSRTNKVTEVKSIIKTEYAKNSRLKSLFLLGRVPVPYSGTFAPDGHQPDHTGAWPADVFYGDIDGDWTDVVESNQGARTENKNNIGDGKYDQDIVPSFVELEVGRVDLANMPMFGVSEVQLLKRYLDKDHAYRTNKIVVEDRGIVEDNFGFMSGEAFSSSAYRAMAPMFGDSNITLGEYHDIFSKGYKVSYGTGAGNYRGAANIANTDTFSKVDSVKTVFTMLFGSYFGDWDVQNNFLRAPLAAKGYCLTSIWSGRPHWVLHPMAMGEHIGRCANISAQDRTTYFRSILDLNFAVGAGRYIALMGDPTLRLHNVSPVKSFKLTKTEDSLKKTTSIKLNWSKSIDKNLKSYQLFTTKNLANPWTLVATVPSTDSAYSIAKPDTFGKVYYMVRGEKLQTTASGSYFNLSQGLMDSTTIKFLVGVDEVKVAQNQVRVNIYPNPAQNNLMIEAIDGKLIQSMEIYNPNGKQVQQNILLNTNSYKLNVSNYEAGLYFIKIMTKEGIITQRFVKE